MAVAAGRRAGVRPIVKLAGRPDGGRFELLPAQGRRQLMSWGASTTDVTLAGKPRMLDDVVETLTAIAAVIGAIGSVTAGIGVLVVNGKIDRLTGRVDALESTMQTVLTLIAGRPAGAPTPPSSD